MHDPDMSLAHSVLAEGDDPELTAALKGRDLELLTKNVQAWQSGDCVMLAQSRLAGGLRGVHELPPGG